MNMINYLCMFPHGNGVVPEAPYRNTNQKIEVGLTCPVLVSFFFLIPSHGFVKATFS